MLIGGRAYWATARRTPDQRTADALVEMARLAASHPDIGTRAGQPPRLVVHATIDQLSWVPGAGAHPAPDGTPRRRRLRPARTS